MFKPSLNWLLIFVPTAVALNYLAPQHALYVFGASCLAIIPLAGWMGESTEHLAVHTGEGIGGLLNATFGNAAELIIALIAIRAGKYDIVKASLTGSILGNILLVLGASILAGGLKYKQQRFNVTAARSLATMLTLAAIALIAPMGFHHFANADASAAGNQRERDLSLEISIVLLFTYALSLLFSLKTHKQLFVGSGEQDSGHHNHPHWSLRKSIGVLLGASVMVAWISEFLVGSVEHAAHELGMTSVFVGVVVVAIIGNAAEHSTSVMMALKNKMELSLTIAIGSSLQIALFVAPVLVLASYAIGKSGPMDLIFTPPEVLAIAVAVIITEQISSDGESNWLEGVQLLSVYLIIAIVFYFLPGPV